MTGFPLTRASRTLVGTMANVARRVLDADAAFVTINDPKGSLLEVSGIDAGHASDLWLVAEWIAIEPKPVSLSDATKKAPYRHSALVAYEPGIRGIAGIPLRNDDGEVIGVMGVLSTTPRRFNVATLQSVAAALLDGLYKQPASEPTPPRAAEPAAVHDSLVLDTVADGVIVIDANGKILRRNSAAAEYAGVSGVSVENRPITTFVPATVIGELQRHFAQPEPEPITRSTAIRRLDGSSLDVEMTVSVIHIDNSVNYVAVFRDTASISRFANSEPATEQTVQRLRESLDTQRQFVRTLSHEFRGAVTGINAFSELIRDGDLTDDEVRDYANDIHIDAQRLSRMCNDILIAERALEPVDALNGTTIDLVSLVSSLIERRRRIDPDHTFDFAAQVPTLDVTLDVDRIIQALTNLLDNAAKYSPNGGRIALAVAATATTAVISVSDEGIGIGPDELDHVFKRHFRTGAAQLSGIAGTGIGLAVVKQIAEQHGGRVEAESDLGKGSTFTMSIPLHRTP